AGEGQRTCKYNKYIKKGEDLAAIAEEGMSARDIGRLIEDTSTGLKYGRLTVEEAIARYDWAAAMLYKM
ncbi:hypothetical protein PQX77_002254, partial [Marasmius sp. AFHP31]